MAYYSIGFAFSFGSSATNHFIGTEYAPLSLVSLSHSLTQLFLLGWIGAVLVLLLLVRVRVCCGHGIDCERIHG